VSLEAIGLAVGGMSVIGGILVLRNFFRKGGLREYFRLKRLLHKTPSRHTGQAYWDEILEMRLDFLVRMDDLHGKLVAGAVFFFGGLFILVKFVPDVVP